MDPILTHHFNNFKTAFEIHISGKSPEESKRNEAKAFEKFANYVLFSLDYPEIFTADLELVEFIFVQSKMRAGFDLGEFSKFALGIKNFFSDGYIPENEQIRDIREIKDFIYSDQKVISKLDRNPSLYIYYVTTGTEINDENYLGAKKALIQDLSLGSFYFDSIEVKAISGKQLIKSCRELENKFEVLLDIIDIFPLIVNLREDIQKAYTFTCKASEFLKILTKDDGLLRRSLFNDNVRDYLGNKGAVNSEIEQTILETPEMFLLCNNGVTIVCSNFEQVRDKLVKIENPQIVNGCQTSNSIFNLKDNPNIEKTQLLVRVISTENLSITNRVVRGTNKQNQVLDEAFETTLPFHQEILEPFFLAIENSTKLYYERRAKQYNSDPLIKKTQIVNLRILTQTFVAMFLDAPHEAHRHEAKLLEDYAERPHVRRIFHDEHNPYFYYACALTWYMFEKSFQEFHVPARYKTFKAHLYYIFRYSVGELPPKLIRGKASDNYCNKLIRLLNDSKFSTQVEQVTKVFDIAEKTWLEQGGSQSGIKDQKGFTELLSKICLAQFFVSQPTPVKEEEPPLYESVILNIIHRGDVWFGFIKRGLYEENLYFDDRGYKGDINKLLPYTKVRYQLGSNLRGDMAINIELVN
jgi:hypothetical protein